MRRKIDISHRTIIFAVFFILSLWVIYLIRDLLILMFVSMILVSALVPLVNFFTRLKVPKALGILLTYIIILAIIGGVLASIIPPLIEQSSKLVNALPRLLSDQFNLLNLDTSIIQSELTSLSKNLLTFTITIFDHFITTIFLLVITFYLMLERESLEKRTAQLFVGKEQRIKDLIVSIEEKLGAWLRGQFFLSIIIGVLSYVGLTVLGIPYALPLALFAGIMEVIPVIGPIISALPAVALALTISPVLAAGTAAMFFVIQQLENHLIVPQVMKRAVGLNPLAVILAIAIGGRLLGISGALLAVPITVVLQIVVTEVLVNKDLRI